MKPFGAVRTYEKCRVVRAGRGKKIAVEIHVKNRRRDRQAKVEFE